MINNTPTGQSIMQFVRREAKKPSLAFILSKDMGYKEPMKLEKKKFSEAYRDSKNIMNQNKEEFCNQLVRRRSFCGRAKIEHATLKEAENAAEVRRQLLVEVGFMKNRKKDT